MVVNFIFHRTVPETIMGIVFHMELLSRELPGSQTPRIIAASPSSINHLAIRGCRKRRKALGNCDVDAIFDAAVIAAVRVINCADIRVALVRPPSPSGLPTPGSLPAMSSAEFEQMNKCSVALLFVQQHATSYRVVFFCKTVCGAPGVSTLNKGWWRTRLSQLQPERRPLILF